MTLSARPYMGLPFLKSAVAVLEASRGPLAADAIVERAVRRGLLDCDATDAAAATMKGVLTNNMRQKGEESHFAALEDGRFELRERGAATGGRVAEPPQDAAQEPGAPPAAKPKPKPKPQAKPKAEPSLQQLAGAGGERLVEGRLNILGYGTAVPDPDEGIDIVATRKGKSYPIQVKTSKGRGGTYTFHLRKSSHERIAGTGAHYVFVLRVNDGNVFVVVPYAEIQKQINVGNIPLKSHHYQIKMRLNTVSLGAQRADMSGYADVWPGAE